MVYLNSTGNSTITFSGSYMTTYSYSATGGWLINTPNIITSRTTTAFSGPKPKVFKGKYRVRCRGCARWSKIVKETKFVNGFSTYRVNCERCLGENDGFT